jgi:glycosyltransferase involved in cell wall biosynthesis
MKTNPKISIVIPAYNAEEFLDKTLQSVLCQSYSNWECIIVNDGSSDKTESIGTSYTLVDNRFKIYSINNSGVSNARNYGYIHSKGEWISFLDADDVWHKSRLETIVKFTLMNNAGLIHHDMEVIDEFEKPTGIVYSGLSGKVLDDLLAWKQCVVPAPSSTLIDRSTFEAAGQWDSSLSTAADQDLFINVANIAIVKRVPIILGSYRVHSNNMHSNIPLMESDHVRVFRKASQNRLFKSFLFKRTCFSNLYMVLAGSWWVNGGSKTEAIRCLAISFFYDPVNFIKHIMKKYTDL